ncbi:hydantoinase B/oxoprolinase family protein [Aestuariivirga litoralis]|uniref:Hydantoinase B/oxoprolinase family protein n=1 Tax=Aestuariivirga litoralis TaxID=2650924 RepID=A0A2W2BWU7_9HYPH|nr:hydantoinase B/oxoprolinase family protein [Aestuariivirga litoralis]PZF77916.1 hydantoinase B/oxoprolinase family protein [Aestuariivirga litoralis]
MSRTASRDALAAIRTQVMWNRLIAVVEEQAQSLLRTAFGTITREAGDLSAGVYDVNGNMIAQAMTGTPGHVNTMATAVAHFFKHYPQSTMKPGDVFITNDPWLGTGHLFDYVMMTPVFLGKKLVAFFASTCHVIDVGGVGMTAKANSSFEEGTLIPHLKVRKEGRLNEELLSVILANSRSPVEVRGDILSLVSANDTGARRLVDMMKEFSLTSLDALAKHILRQSEKGAREAIKALPEGEWSYEMPLDGYERELTLKSKLIIKGGKITVDFSGSSPASLFGINSPRTYTHAYAVFGLKAVIAPHVPNNIGSLSCFDLVTEPGTIVDPIRPSPVTARHVIGQMLADSVFGCLAQALPGTVQAESAGPIWILSLYSAHGRVPPEQTAKAKNFAVINMGLGGIGGRPGKDGLATTAFPSGVGTIPIEVTETQCPLYFRRKHYLADSGGAGQWRGGVSQRIEIANTEDAPFAISAATFDRVIHPAQGREGGQPGCVGLAARGSGSKLPDKGIHIIEAGDSLVLELPGGGGFGRPDRRDRAALEADIAAGLVTVEAARRDYGHEG